MSSFEERIREARSDLSPSFNRLADYLLDSYTQSAFLTATELAHTLDLDPATVVRFSQRLGYSGYPDLQRDIRKKVKRELTVAHKLEANTNAQAAINALEQVGESLEMLSRAFPVDAAQALIAVLDESERVVLLAEGLAASPARDLAAWLEMAGYSIHLSNGSPAELARALAGIRKGDLVLAFDVAEGTPFVSQALAEARQAGARTAAFVAAPSSDSARHADLVLAAPALPHPGTRQILLESMLFAFQRMLAHARPRRFQEAEEQVRLLTERLTNLRAP